jgi:hypothetical protein
MWDDLLVNGTSLRDFGKLAPALLINPAPARGDNVTYPGADYETFVPKVKGSPIQPAYLTVMPWDRATKVTPSDLLAQRAQLNQNVLDLAALVVDLATPLTLTRKVSLPSGNVSQTASAELVGALQPELIVAYGGRCPLSFKILSDWT